MPQVTSALVAGVLVSQWTVRNGAEGILFDAERSLDLISWAPATYLGRVNNGDGQTSTLSFQGVPAAGDRREFVRFNATELP